ncbi:MAG: hypothetical protein HY882_04510 [Deltaproteobacteria bacterium]|nr:hypothetical protein [Deltaproteobacteria bacterium]
MRRRFQPKMGEKSIKVVFYKVQSGTELDVVKNIEDKITLAKIEDFKIFKVFGPFDLLMIYETDERKSLLSQGVIPGIINSLVFDCFTWKTKDKSDNWGETFSFERIDRPLLGIVFFKMKPSIFKSSPTEIDWAFMDLFKGKNASALGCFGWADAIALWSGNSMVELARQMDKITTVHVRNRKGHFVERLALKTYSFCTIRFDYCRQVLEGGELPGAPKHDIAPDPMTEVYAALELSCRPDAHRRVVEECRTKFKVDPILSLGKEDLILNIATLNWPEFLKTLLFFRKEFTNELYSTCVRIFNKTIPAYQEAGSTPSPTYKVDIDRFLEKILKEDFGEGLLCELYALNQYAQNELLADDVKGLLAFVEQFLENYLGNRELEGFESLLQLLETGINQRLVGAFVGTEDHHSGIQYSKGGIQKILTAAEVIPRTLLSWVGVPWNGFIVLGSAPDYRHDLDIINLPGKTWHDPTAWWGIFHETGHIYAFYHKAYSNKYLDKIAREMILPLPLEQIDEDRANVAGGTDYGTALRYLTEIIADAFDVRYGFVSQADLYVKTVWPYLLKEHVKKVSVKINDYVGRSISALMVNEMLTTEKYSFDDEKITELYDSLIDKLNSIDRDLSGFNLKKDSVTESIANLRGFLVHIAKAMRRENKTIQRISSYWKSQEFGEIANNIKEGILPTQKIDFPHLLILYFLEKMLAAEPVPAAATVALIKTLWYQSIFHSSGLS